MSLAIWKGPGQYGGYYVNGVEYRVWNNGDVTDSKNIFLTKGGVEGLKSYLTKQQYTIITINNEVYKMFSNKTVIDSTGHVVSTNGVDGLHDYINAHTDQ